MKSVFSISKVVLLSFFVMVVASCGGKEERKADYLEKGKAYLADNNLKKARIEFKNVLQIDPKYAEAYFYMGQLEEKNKELRRAVGFYKKAIELDPKYIQPKIELSRIFILVGTKEYIDQAKELLNEALLLDKNNLEVKLVNATIEYKTGNKANAIKKMEKIVFKDFSLKKGVSLLAAIYDQNGAKDKAIDLLEKGAAANKDDISLKLSLAKVYASADKLVKAEKELLDIIKLDSEDIGYRVVLSKFYTATKENNKAEKVLRDAIAIDDEDVKRHLLLVEFLSKNKGIREAEKELLSIIKNNSDVYEYKFSLSELYLKEGNSDKVKEVLNSIIDEKTHEVEGFKARTRLAKVFFSEKNIPQANKLLEAVLTEYPNDTDALFVSSKISIINKNAQEAINGLRTVLKNQPTNVEASKLLSAAHQMLNEDDLAEDVLKNSIGSAPLDYKSHLNYATYLASKRKLTDASDVLEKALLYFEDEYELLDLKIKIAAARKNEAEIVKVLSAMKSTNPNRHEPYVKQGQYYLVKNKYSEAISEFEQALTRTNDKFEILGLIVKAYLVQELPEKAIKRINERLQKHKNDSISYHLLGKVYATQKNYDKASDSFRSAISNNKSWIAPYKALASIYEIKGNIKKAENVYSEAIENVDNSLSARMQLASLYEKNKQYKKAMQQYETILSEAPENNAVKNNLAALLIDHDASDNSIQKAKELTKGFETIQHPALRDTLAWVYVKSGENDKAREILEQVVEKSPDVAVFKYHLGVALNNLGEKLRAKTLLTDSVNSDQKFSGKDQARQLIKDM